MTITHEQVRECIAELQNLREASQRRVAEFIDKEMREFKAQTGLQITDVVVYMHTTQSVAESQPHYHMRGVKYDLSFTVE